MKTHRFTYRHIGPSEEEQQEMLSFLGLKDLDALIYETIPDEIRLDKALDLPPAMTEYELADHMDTLAGLNKRFRSFIGYGFYATHLPGVLRRNILENPAWYTSYTPYQAEISQGRLEALINYQTMLTELTGLDLANASLLDDATAAAEAMLMLYNMRSRQQKKQNINRFFVSRNLFPHIAEVIKTRAYFKGIELVFGDEETFQPDETFFGAIFQNPGRTGEVKDLEGIIKKWKEREIKTVVVADLLSLALLTPPGRMGADVVVGNTQRFGLPLFYGGPHTGFFVTKSEYKRYVPGRIIGVTRDKFGKQAYRMALQTREQHIKRDHATSNICTSQVLLAVLNGMYAVYHGKEGLQEIAQHVHKQAVKLKKGLESLGLNVKNHKFFDTVQVVISPEKVRQIAEGKQLNFNYFEKDAVLISTDELTTDEELKKIIEVFEEIAGKKTRIPQDVSMEIPEKLLRKDDFLHQEVFQKYRSETALMRYIKSLERKDINLTTSMIPLGSCTMKLNAASELFYLTDPRWADIHPFVPREQAQGYAKLFERLEKDLAEITGMDAVSLQPNSGAAGEYAGLVAVKSYFEDKGEHQRNIALIPASAHGTNPASAVMAGFKVVVVKTTDQGNIDVEDLTQKAEKYADELGVLMVTYPSTHGVFEKDIVKITETVHRYGGLVYMDGANMNAQTGLTSPAKIGADVLHLNLHKTFAIPHGGGGPGVGPIAVKSFLAPYLPSHVLIKTGGEKGRQVASAPWGSAGVMSISYAYIRLSGADGLKKMSEIAILNANYLEKKISPYFPTLYKGEKGRVAHEFIADFRPYKSNGIQVMDVAKRLMDFGYHAPTVSFPVAGTLMIEPTESENKEELDRFAEVMKKIFEEIQQCEPENTDNPLVNAPHTQEEVTAEMWFHGYSRKEAAFPLKFVAENKIWPSVARVDEAFGDRHLHCTCDPVEFYADEESRS